jgi:predicted NBD/HSP70 family sugar kinase
VAAGWAIRRRAEAPGTLAELEALRDPRVDRVLEDAAEALGAATAWLVNLLDPSLVILGDTAFARGAGRFFATFDAATRAHAVGGELQIVHGAPDAQTRGTIQCALELLPELLRPRRSICV